MIQTNWYVITGAPSSGKTTLIDQLAQLGYVIAPEVARDYIEGLLSHNLSLEDIKKNNTPLQRGILALALKRERHLRPQDPIFFDRGTADSLGYFTYYQLETRTITQACQHLRYKKIFYCHQLPVEHDEIRVEDNVIAQQIGEHIYKAYNSLGYELIELPAVSVEERMKLIVPHLDELGE